ncbi:hypothetical protein QJS10_CPA09g00947 [Acorus calamus]|uniref:Uncharacterized protein n=1 Tax=Acorus calamus TaxID=4465 RepID=A0AAV9E676_ACOCL|nr:hypothetical protein QJS10_CPA09g00947 [Acorus calamus]
MGGGFRARHLERFTTPEEVGLSSSTTYSPPESWFEMFRGTAIYEENIWDMATQLIRDWGVHCAGARQAIDILSSCHEDGKEFATPAEV